MTDEMSVFQMQCQRFVSHRCDLEDVRFCHLKDYDADDVYREDYDDDVYCGCLASTDSFSPHDDILCKRRCNVLFPALLCIPCRHRNLSPLLQSHCPLTYRHPHHLVQEDRQDASSSMQP